MSGTRAPQLGLTLLVSVLLVPTSLSGWGVKGSLEPDTTFDLNGWMALTPNVDPQVNSKVYFNGFGTTGAFFTTTLNPNLAMTGSALAPAPFVPAALFGIWKDCNADGYVGLGEQGLLEYPAQLMANASICPVQPLDAGIPPWTIHNDGRWVVEYIPIGYDDVTTMRDDNPLNINDTGARVWADWGLPGDAPSLTCATFPAPHGTFRSTGGLLRWADCASAFRATRTVNALADALGREDLSFSDAPEDRPDLSGSTLNQPNPWGSEEDASMVRVFDCSRRTTIEVHDPTGGALRNIASIPVGDRTFYLNGTDGEGRVISQSIPEIFISTHERGSPAGSVNETQAGLTDCDRTNPGGEMIGINGRNGGSDADIPYTLEGPNEPVSPSGRTRPDHTFAFTEGARQGSALFGPRARDDASLAASSVMGFWIASSPGLAGRNPYVSFREASPEPVTHITYYAHVSQSLITAIPLHMPLGHQFAFYGIDGCQRGHFVCDPALWWLDSAGNDIVPRDANLGSDPHDPTVPAPTPATTIGVRIGQPFHMRDIDCIDHSVAALRAQDVHWGRLTGTSCARPPP